MNEILTLCFSLFVQVKVWFQNRRTKHKRSTSPGEDGAEKNGDGRRIDDNNNSSGGSVKSSPEYAGSPESMHDDFLTDEDDELVLDVEEGEDECDVISVLN